ncbi:hypothetical protein [Desulfacinum hydrothermale]|nr:hypothetical protein [Desulfacinum hydrothermale]
MALTPERLKEQKEDYFVAQWEDEQLYMTPHCHCGNVLDEQYYCDQCKRQCTCQVILCRDGQTLNVVEKFLHGNPDFKHFQVHLLEEDS